MKNSSTSSISAVTLLTLVFVVLKLTHVIGWSWWCVLSPLWISAAIAVVFVIVWTIVAIIKRRK
jgi:MFS superfamily sulfate permease-like transporter